MALTIKLKGKKRALDESCPNNASLAFPPENEPPHPTKRVKRAETRQCPVCNEHIPLRLLSKHAQLESERVEEVIRKVGSSDLPYDEIDNEPGPSSRARRSAIKARKSIMTHAVNDSLEQSSKTIQTIKRHRKQRNTKLKEMAKEEEEANHARNSWLKRFTGEEMICPVCSAIVRGDQDVLDAHVDACLAHEAQRQEEACQQEIQHRRATEDEDWDADDDIEGTGGYVGNVRGVGFHTRSHHQQDVDEDIDIDGDDQAVFGEAQFTEGDVVPVNVDREDVEEDVEVELEGESDDEAQQAQKTLRDLVAAGKIMKRRTPGQGEENVKNQMDKVMGAETDKMDLAILSAHQRGDKTGIILALEDRIKLLESTRVSSSTSLLCRICLDPYSDPTVSTGCWHTCCRECWLRCLGSTKLCPICKRITGATDLRRVYL